MNYTYVYCIQPCIELHSLERENLQNTLRFALLLAFENNGLDLGKTRRSGLFPLIMFHT